MVPQIFEYGRIWIEHVRLCMRTYRYVGLFSLLCFSYFALAESDSVKYGEGRRDSGLPVEDDCKIINEALAAAQTGFGASFTLTPLAPNQAWNCKSPVVIGQNNHVIILSLIHI